MTKAKPNPSRASKSRRAPKSAPKRAPKAKKPAARPKPPAIPEKWRALFKLIPGYDPIATAGDCTFHADAADAAIAFFAECLTHIEGALAGKPLALEPWQQAIVGCVFGWKRPNGLRRYREIFQYVPRKNGKSTMLGGLINLVGFCDAEPGAQIYSAAAEKEQAALVYRQAKGMILNNPELEAEAKIYATFRSIEYPGGSVYKALSADADTKHGFNTHFVVVDELHAQPNRDLIDVLVTSTGSRTQPLIWYITTADFDRPSICNEKLAYAEKVRDGQVKDESFLPVIYDAAPDADWKSEKVWHQANPNLGVSVSIEYLRRECLRAIETPTYENTFKRLHLNMRTQNDVKWLDIARWDAGGGEPIDPALLEGRACYGALDLSTRLDITCFLLLFPPTEADPKWRVLPKFYVPADNAEIRERRDRVPYQTWGRQGIVTLTPGNVIDYEWVKRDVLAAAKLFEIREIAYDPWNATQIALQLADAGATMKEFGQGFKSMSEPTKELEKLVVSRQLAHGGNEVLRWMAGNCTVETDPAGNLKPSKKKSTEKIDGIVCLVMALGLSMAQAGDGGSVYEDRGVLMI